MLGHRTLTIEDYLTILKRRWLVILIPTVILPILAFGISYRMTPIYTSQTLILIEQPKVPDDYVKSVVDESLDNRLASMKEQILSRSRLEPIIKQYNLGDPKADMDTRLESVRTAIGIKAIHSDISGAGGLPGFYISFKAGDAHTAQQVCRQITSLFITESAKSRAASAQGTTEFLEEQLNDAKSNLDAQDAKLAAFQRENIGALPDDQDANMNMLTTLNTQLDAANQALGQLQQERSYREAMLAQQGSGLISTSETGSKPGPAQRGAAQATPEQAAEMQKLQDGLADLLNHYTPDYPDVIATKRRIADLKKEIAANGVASGPNGAPVVVESPAVRQLHMQISAIDDAIQQKRKDQSNIQRQIGMYQGRMQASPLVAAKYKELSRDYATAEKGYDDLLAKKNQSQMATELENQQQGEQLRLMDDANLPDEPTFPKRSMFALGGLAAGLALGVLLAAYLEYRDKSLRSERDVWAFTKLPTLGIIALSPNATASATNGTSWFKRRLKPANPPLAKVGG
ncbi:MAG TPA: Wzz/FepE/Etk N-terminal domain-containing protein [Acidobacteriaceae bacterium]|nr:Wzz/FepE/Etk N-terminal domain-containing protein [Acidobacteriaceae bacterium]